MYVRTHLKNSFLAFCVFLFKSMCKDRYIKKLEKSTGLFKNLDDTLLFFGDAGFWCFFVLYLKS